MPSPRSHLDALTGLRFFAALAVVVYHWGQPLLADAPWWIQNIFANSYTGVSLFFVLSGFVLTYVYTGRQTISKPEFYRTRIARLYPLYLVGLVLALPTLALLLVRDSSNWGQHLLTLGLVLTATQAWIPTAADVLNPPAWSLSVEALFYALFPFLLPILIKNRTRFAVKLAGAVWAVTLASAVIYTVIQPDGVKADPALHGVWINALRYNPLMHINEFLWGCAGGLLFVRGQISKSVFLIAGPLGTVVLIGLAVAPLASVPYPVLHSGLMAPVFAAFIVALAGGRGLLAHALSNKTVVLLGEASYSLYILHVPVWLLITNAGEVLGISALAQPQLFLAYLPLMIALSVLTYRYIELPARKALQQWFQSRSTIHAA